MRQLRVLTAFLPLILLVCILELTSGQPVTQQAQAQSKKDLKMLPYFYPPKGCYPAEVKGVSYGGQPPEVLLAEVTIQGFSERPITAVKLGWNVYQEAVGMKKVLAACDAPPVEGEIILSGTTPLIELKEWLFQNETYNIGTYPLKASPHADKTIYIDQPIIMWEQVKSLTNDGTRNSINGSYLMVIYVSEIRFADKTKWEGKVK